MVSRSTGTHWTVASAPGEAYGTEIIEEHLDLCIDAEYADVEIINAGEYW